LLRKDEPLIFESAEPARGYRAFYQGVLTEVLNPKTALFFLAFIPQFVDPRGPVVLQFVLLGSISVFLNASADVVVATLAGPIGTQLKKRASLRRAQRLLTGCGLVALGAFVAFAGEDHR
ncbi:MAG: LysE family transporter, partial [Anaerolineae bacterium]|nr:LysE family transporter [Anaerolineae bacterium]